MSSPRLLHIRSSYFYGGPERQITYLTKALAEMGIESGVATFALKKCPERNRYFSVLQDFDYPSHLVTIAHSFDPSAHKSLENLIRSQGYTILIGHDYRSHYFILKQSRRLGLLGLAYSRGWTTENFKVRMYEWLDIRFLRRMDGVIAVSPSKFDELSSHGIPEERLVYIPNSIITEGVKSRQNLIRQKFNIPADAFVVGTAGRLSAEKSHETLIAAAVNLLKADPDIYIIIAGEGDRRAYLTSLIPDHLRGKIILAGWIADNDAFYADIDLFVLTSLTEGFPNVLLEAGKYRLPVISTAAGGAVEIIREAETGLFIPFCGVKPLEEKIRLTHEDPTLRKRLGENLGRLTREKFDAKANAVHFLNFVRKVEDRLAGRPGRIEV